MDRLLNVFIEEPNKEYHIRELARFIKLSATTVSKYLEKYRKEGILTSKRERGHILFKANIENKNYKDIKLYCNIEKIRKSGLIEHLINELNRPESIILFGSFRKADNTPSSDIDLFILTPIKREINTDKFKKRLKHNIQLFMYSKKEFELLKRNNKELLNNILKGISLEGFLEVF